MALKDRLMDVPVVGTAIRVQQRYTADAGDQFAGAIGFFGFLSLFPLLLLALSIAGFVLTDRQVLEVAERIQDAIPGFSAVLGGGSGVAGALTDIVDNRHSVGIIGLVALLLSGLRIANAAQTATLKVFRVDLLALKGFRRKLQQLWALALLGLLALAGVGAAAALGWAVNAEVLGAVRVLAPVLSVAGTFVLDVGLFLAAYRLFATPAGPPTRHLVPGAILGGLGWTALKVFGATYVSGRVAQAEALYGTIAAVIGLLVLLYLAGRLYVYGAELSAVRYPPPEAPDVAAPASATEPPVDDDAPVMEPIEPGPAEVVARPRPDEASPAVSPATRARIADRQAATAATHAEDRGARARHAVAFALGVGALAGVIGALRPWDDDDE